MNPNYTGPGSLDEELRRELTDDERIVWSGRPRPGLRLRTEDALMIPFSFIWGGFSFFWEYSAWTTNAPIFFRLWGIPFVLVGVHITVGRFFVDAMSRARTLYGLTDRRAIILSGFVNRNVRSIDLRATSEIELTESSDLSGTITFGSIRARESSRRGSRVRLPQFEMIEDARAVYKLAREIHMRATNPSQQGAAHGTDSRRV